MIVCYYYITYPFLTNTVSFDYKFGFGFPQIWRRFFFVFLGPHPLHMEVPRLGVELELQLPPFAIAIATQNLSLICNLHHSSWQHRIINPLSEAKDRTCILMDTSQVVTTEPQQGTPLSIYFFFFPLWLFRAAPEAYGSFQARGQIGAAASSLHQSHNNLGSKPQLWSTPQVTARPDPRPTEQGQGLNLNPYGY